MRCLVLLLLIGAPAAAQPTLTPDDARAFVLAQSFTCERKTCGQMRSCAEACHALTVCGDRRRDGDGDGIPCETLCSRPCR